MSVLDEWVAKAEGDAAAANRLAATEPAVLDAACFHAQQCVEKYLKAVLVQRGEMFPKVHDLVALARLAARHLAGLPDDDDDVKWLTEIGVEVRYPGEDATREDVERALDIMQRWRARLRSALGRPG